MYSAPWMDQFEVKGKCIEFIINNVLPQCNVKIILNLKVEEIWRDCRPIFCGINDNAQEFSLALSETYS